MKRELIALALLGCMPLVACSGGVGGNGEKSTTVVTVTRPAGENPTPQPDNPTPNDAPPPAPNATAPTPSTPQETPDSSGPVDYQVGNGTFVFADHTGTVVCRGGTVPGAGDFLFCHHPDFSPWTNIPAKNLCGIYPDEATHTTKLMLGENRFCATSMQGNGALFDTEFTSAEQVKLPIGEKLDLGQSFFTVTSTEQGLVFDAAAIGMTVGPEKVDIIDYSG
ncbi:hypothetical protein [Corynebacterium aquilae]|uniref:Uncharacterized protein n=1 Tax=Corynebacterium aquilae DSM 44791 TaxID=1431546 RepID=A0A1L7CHA4_9CORY|nr:hypothetical protein [Corynebacterium aquilae]APT85209.1 hypothetical protein CAQU_09135 [Corynebacterium aquilae DSM 44791]